MFFKSSMHKLFKNNLFVLPIFFILAIVSASILLLSHAVIEPNVWDASFHWSRIYEIHSSIINNWNPFTRVAVSRFHQDGSAAMTLYPYINLFPAVLITFVFKSFTHVFYTLVIFRNFFSFVIAYFSSLKFNKNKKISFLFSISYTLSSLTLYYMTQDMDMGVSSAVIFLPMVLFGTMEFIRNREWQELSIGIIAVIFSHVITSILSIFFVIVLILLNIKQIKTKNHMYSLCKAIASIILVTSVFWIPFVILNITNDIAMPLAPGELVGYNTMSMLSDAMNNNVTSGFSIISLIGVILSIINYRNLKTISKNLFWISIVTLCISTPFFPWNILNNTFLKQTFQSPLRLFVVINVLFCYLFAENVIEMCRRHTNQIIAIICLTMSIIMVQVVQQKTFVNNNSNNHFDANLVLSNHDPLVNDYWPVNYRNNSQATNITNNSQIEYNNKTVSAKLLGNGKFSFLIDKKAKNIKMPFMMYNSVNYQVKLDGKNTKFYSNKYSQLSLNNLGKGKHIVQVIVHKSWYDYLSYVLSALGVIILASAWIRSLILKRKNKE